MSFRLDKHDGDRHNKYHPTSHFVCGINDKGSSIVLYGTTMVTFSLSKLLRLKPAVSSVIIIIPLTSEMDSISTHCIRKDILRIGIGLDRKKVPLLEYRP